MRLVFFGNGAFGIPTLQALANSVHEVTAVITNPDKPAGRGHQPTPTPIKEAALKLGIPIWEVDSPKDPTLPDRLRAIGAHAFVVIAYRILPRALWELPPYGALNLHPSLLPAYRGAAPIPWTIIHGETETGLSIFQINEGIDTGMLLYQEKYPLPETWSAGDLENFLAEVGARAILQVLEELALGTLRPFPQPHLPDAPYAPKLTSANTRIRWDKSARAIYNLIRGLYPQPLAWTTFQDKRLQVLRATYHPHRTFNAPPGTLYFEKGHLLVACSEGVLELLEVRLEGRKTLSGADFAHGFLKKQTHQLV